MLLEIAEIGGIYPYGMVTVTHLLEFFQIAFRQWRPFVFLFTGCGFLDGGIVYKRHFHIVVEELGKHEILSRQISSATDKQYVFFLRQRQADVIVIAESHFDKFFPVFYHRRKFDLGFRMIYFHRTGCKCGYWLCLHMETQPDKYIYRLRLLLLFAVCRKFAAELFDQHIVRFICFACKVDHVFSDGVFVFICDI